MREQEEGVLISINPPFSRMIISEFKPIEFRNKIIKTIKKGTKLFIYETKNKGGIGAILGEAVVEHVFDYNLIGEPAEKIGVNPPFLRKNENEEFVECIETIVEIEHDEVVEEISSCELCPFESYCRSHELLLEKFRTLKHENKVSINFDDYIKQIGFGGYYGIVLSDIHAYSIPIALNNYYYREHPIRKPPQNMMNVIFHK